MEIPRPKTIAINPDDNLHPTNKKLYIFVILYIRKMNEKKIKICIVEDDEDIRKMTIQILETSNKIICTDSFASAEEFLKFADKLSVDIILMDIGLPQMSGTECVRYCNINNKQFNFVMYTTHFLAEEVFEALRSGAKGYILKGSQPNQLINNIYELVEGGSPMSPRISRLVTESFNQTDCSNSEIARLTKQEREVLAGLEKGFTYKEIAIQRFVSAHTVRAQIRSIYEKLHVHNKIEAIKLFHNPSKSNT